MTDSIFDHDQLDVYRFSTDYVAASFVVAKQLDGHHRHARDQWLRAAQSIPLNIAEGNGKRSLGFILIGIFVNSWGRGATALSAIGVVDSFHYVIAARRFWYCVRPVAAGDGHRRGQKKHW